MSSGRSNGAEPRSRCGVYPVRCTHTCNLVVMQACGMHKRRKCVDGFCQARAFPACLRMPASHMRILHAPHGHKHSYSYRMVTYLIDTGI